MPKQLQGVWQSVLGLLSFLAMGAGGYHFLPDHDAVLPTLPTLNLPGSPTELVTTGISALENAEIDAHKAALGAPAEFAGKIQGNIAGKALQGLKSNIPVDVSNEPCLDQMLRPVTCPDGSNPAPVEDKSTYPPPKEAYLLQNADPNPETQSAATGSFDGASCVCINGTNCCNAQEEESGIKDAIIGIPLLGAAISSVLDLF